MERIYRFLKKADTQLYLTLALMIFVIWCLRGFLSIILLTAIFAYLAVNASLAIQKRISLPYWLVVTLVYLVTLAIFIAAISYAAPMLIEQLKVIPAMISKAITDHPVWNKTIDQLVNQAIHSSEVVSNGKTIAITGLREVGHVGTGFSHFLMALFLSFVFSVTRGRMIAFGHEFLTSKFSHFFSNVYYLARKFVLILGRIIETQLLIATINTILMTIGLYLLGMPSLLVLTIIVFILGIIPVAGVLISLVPLTLIAFASGGIIRVGEVIVLIIIIHLFESYFLHPRLMADRTDLPVFATFITLIVMESLLGTWGLIVGLPIVSFFLDIFGVQDSEKHHGKPIKQ